MYLKQKSRAKWIQLGDSNNKYFTAIMKERTQRKHILKITALTGDKLTHPDDIKEEIVGFYHIPPTVGTLCRDNGTRNC